MRIGSATAYQTAMLALAPVGYWRSNEASGTSLADFTANANAGTLTGTVRVGMAGPLPAQPSKSVGYTGNVSYCSIPSIAAYRSSETFSVSFWARSDQGKVSTSQKILSTAFSTSWRVTVTSTGGVQLDALSGAQVANYSTRVFDGNKWVFVTITYDGATKGVVIYVNGQQVQTATFTAHPGNTVNTAMKIADSDTSGFVGSIAEVARFDKVLTLADVQNLWAASQVAGTTPTIARARRIAPRDALHAKMLTEWTRFANWTRRHQVQGYIGEVGWPDSTRNEYGTGSADVPRWNALGEMFYALADEAGWHVTYWDASIPDYWQAAYLPPSGGYGTTATKNTQAAVLEAHPSFGSVLRGVNFDRPAGRGAPGASTADTGAGGYRAGNSIGTGAITYDDAQSFANMYAYGHRLVRLAFRWERVQSTLNGALDGEIANMDAWIARAAAAGLQIVLDCHNYGCYWYDGGLGDTHGYRHTIGIANGTTGQTVTTAHFTDLWTKLANRYKAQANMLCFGLMNEPRGGLSSAQWEAISQAAVTSIRGTGATQYVSVGTEMSPSGLDWQDSHPTPWIVDPLNKVWYEHHTYCDDNNFGTYDPSLNLSSYAENLALAQAKGYRA